MESVGWFKNEFRKVYEEKGFTGAEINVLLKAYADMGSFAHDKRQPGKELLSGHVNAILVAKPAIDAITGKNCIIGEELTDLERAMLVDTISGMASYTVGSVCDANGLPPGAGLLECMVTLIKF